MDFAGTAGAERNIDQAGDTAVALPQSHCFRGRLAAMHANARKSDGLLGAYLDLDSSGHGKMFVRRFSVLQSNCLRFAYDKL